MARQWSGWAQQFLEKETPMLDLKNWLNPGHYSRLWNVGPAGFLMSLFLIYLIHTIEISMMFKTFELEGFWFLTLVLITAADFFILMVWVLFSLPPKNRGIKLSRVGIYGYIRHPIYTAIIYHLTIFCALFWGSYALLFFIPFHHALWSKIVIREEEYLVGIFGQDYVDYMSDVPRFIPWK